MSFRCHLLNQKPLNSVPLCTKPCVHLSHGRPCGSEIGYGKAHAADIGFVHDLRRNGLDRLAGPGVSGCITTADLGTAIPKADSTRFASGSLRMFRPFARTLRAASRNVSIPVTRAPTGNLQ